MSIRHSFAIAAVQTQDLLELCRLLAGAVQNAFAEGQMPHMDPAIQLITHQIAFCGNGDSQLLDHYVKTFEFCLGQCDATILEKPKAPELLIS